MDPAFVMIVTQGRFKTWLSNIMSFATIKFFFSPNCCVKAKICTTRGNEIKPDETLLL